MAVSRKGGVWSAVTTEAGKHYLRQGTYSSNRHVARHGTAVAVPVLGKESPVSGRSAAVSSKRTGTRVSRSVRVGKVDERAEDLVARVVQAGGVLEIDAEDYGTDYKGLCKAAKQAPNLPFGKQLRVRKAGPWWADGCEIYFDEDFAARVVTRPVPVPQRVATYHPAVAAYRADSGRHEVSKDSLGRASRILQALADEAVRRGYTVNAVEKQADQYPSARIGALTDGQLWFVIDEFSYRLRIREQGTRGRRTVSSWPQRARMPLWQQDQKSSLLPIAELRITLEKGSRREGRQAEFRDAKRATLEEQLPDVLRELEIRAAEDSWRRLQEQRQAQDKSRHWERVMDQARHDFRQAQLAAVLREQLKNWRLGQELDAYLAAMEASIPGIVGERQQMAATEWLTWAREYRRSVDPLANPLAMLTVPEPTPEDLKPFLQGWNPYGPGK